MLIVHVYLFLIYSWDFNFRSFKYVEKKERFFYIERIPMLKVWKDDSTTPLKYFLNVMVSGFYLENHGCIFIGTFFF